MQKETARSFWRRFLTLANRGKDVSVVNPARDFTVSVGAGEYDHMPTEQYDTILGDYEQLSAIWHDRPQAPADDILLNALRMTCISDDKLSELSEILAKCSTESIYAPETESDPPPSDIGEHVANALKILFPTPKDIYDHLCQRVRGQEEAKKAAATVMYNHLNGRRTNALFCGPSGCGKTEIWRCLAKEYHDLIRIVDASRLSADGWKGSLHLRDIFGGIPASDLNTDGLIVVLDEADKICCEAAIGAGGTNYNALVQNSLLKMLDGDVIEFGQEDNNRKSFSVDCSRVSVVLLGAFERLLEGKSRNSGSIGFGSPIRHECDYSNTTITHDDLIAAGMRREIAGRINRIVPLRPLTVEDYRAILTGPVLDNLQSARKCTIYINAQCADSLARQAMVKGLGVRWMKSQVINALDDLMFDDPRAEEYTIESTSNDYAAQGKDANREGSQPTGCGPANPGGAVPTGRTQPREPRRSTPSRKDAVA